MQARSRSRSVRQSKIAFYEKVVQKCRRGRSYEFEYDENGKRVKIDKEPLINQKAVTAVLTDLKKEKDNLEEKIAAVNFNTSIDFDPEKILSRIRRYNEFWRIPLCNFQSNQNVF
ncbi:MAG: hypothetical protein LBK61_14075 [Spirochaetaceae bacterium]|nr:hypothetical protein [Spirochaetaceae bacterium]